MFRNEFSKNLVISIALLPAIVAVLIMLINGNIGAGVAVGGVFALTRFRSAQGTAKEITHIFLAMAIGLILGLVYVGIAVILIVSIAWQRVWHIATIHMHMFNCLIARWHNGCC
jgi:hypothetical protein